MLRPTQICVALFWLAAGRGVAAELDLTGERVPDAEPGRAACVQLLDSASPAGPESLRALLVPAAAPLPPAADVPLADPHAGRLGCEATAEPDLPRAAAPAASGHLGLDVPEELDAGCWDVALTRGCVERRIPLHALRPEHEPGRFSAWLDTGPVRAKRRAQQAAAAGGLRVLDATPLMSLGGTLLRLGLEDGADPEQTRAALEELKAQPELRQRAIVYRGNPAAQARWGVTRIGASDLHAAASGAGIRIALLDSAVAETHPDLAAPVELTRDFSGFEPAAGLHGTALAGILAAAGSGVAPRAKLISVAACRDEPGGTAARCWSSALVRALDAAVAARARIALLGWNGPEDALVARALERAAKSGVLLVAAVGDAGDERSPAFPASHPAVLGVTAVDREGAVFGPAARGESVDLAAPGVDLAAATLASDRTQPLSGSALAAAHVAGAAALLLELAPRVTGEKLRETLAATAVDLGEPGRDPVFGDGLIDVCGAARALRASAGSAEDPCPGRP